MKLKTERVVSNNIHTTTISFGGYGTATLTAEEEFECLESYPAELIYSDMKFEGTYTLNGSEVEAGGTDTIKLSINNKRVMLDENFTVSFRIDANALSSSVYSSNTDINTAALYCQAACILFEDTIKAKVATLLSASRAKNNNFEQSFEDVI